MCDYIITTNKAGQGRAVGEGQEPESVILTLFELSLLLEGVAALVI